MARRAKPANVAFEGLIHQVGAIQRPPWAGSLGKHWSRVDRFGERANPRVRLLCESRGKFLHADVGWRSLPRTDKEVDCAACIAARDLPKGKRTRDFVPHQKEHGDAGKDSR